MALEGDIRTALLTLSAVTALVGTGAAARIRPYKLEQSDDWTAASIVVEVDNRDHLNDLSGTSARAMVDVNLSCRAMTRSAANALAAAVRLNGTDPGTGLHGYDGAAFSSWLEDDTASILHFDDGSDRDWQTVEMSFKMTHAEVA